MGVSSDPLAAALWLITGAWSRPLTFTVMVTGSDTAFSTAILLPCSVEVVVTVRVKSTLLCDGGVMVRPLRSLDVRVQAPVAES